MIVIACQYDWITYNIKIIIFAHTSISNKCPSKLSAVDLGLPRLPDPRLEQRHLGRKMASGGQLRPRF